MKLFSQNSKTSSINTYKSIEDFPLYNFDRYMITKEPNWFVIGYNGTGEKVDVELLQPIVNAILDEYYYAIDDKSFQMKLQKWQTLSNLETRYNCISQLIYTMLAFGFEADKESQERRFKFIDILEQFGFKMPKINTTTGDVVELQRINQEKEGLKNKIALLQTEINEESEINTQSLQTQLLYATRSLDLKFLLNPKEISVKQWISICEQMKEIAKNN